MKPLLYNFDNMSDSSKEIDLISGMRVEKRLKCTEQQSEILSACFIGGDDANRAFNQIISLKFKGNLDKAILKQVLNEMVLRNEALRMVFDIPSNQSIITLPKSVDLDLLKLSSSDDVDTSFVNIKDELANLSFDLRKGPLYKFVLLTAPGADDHLVLCLHHVICDGWTLALIIDEIGVLYNKQLGSSKELPNPIPYSTFVESEDAYHSSLNYQETRGYWKDLFNNFKPLPALPYDSPRTNEYTYRSSHVSYPLHQGIYPALRKISDEAGCSLLVSMAAIFEVLLYRRSGVPNFVIGLPTAGQAAAGMDRLMGHCVNMLPMLTNVNGKQDFISYLISRAKAYKKAFENRRITFGNLLKHINFDRGQTSLPLIPVTFNIDRPLIGGELIEGVETSMEIGKRNFSSFDMIINISRVSEKLVIECDFNDQCFSKNTVTDLLKQYEYLLNALSMNPETCINSCDLFDLDTVKNQLQSFNSTFKAIPEDTNVYDLVRKHALSHPDKLALSFKDSKLSYSELLKKIDHYASGLSNQGVLAGDFVGIMLDRSSEMLIAIHAVLKLGAAYVPIDPEFPEQRINYMLQDSNSKTLICERRFVKLAGSGCQAITCEELEKMKLDASLDSINSVNYANETAYVIYTSGSTGLPKGVAMSHGSLLNLLLSIKSEPGFDSNDKLLALTTVSFDISVLELCLPLISGGTIVLASAEISKSGDDIIELVTNENVTVLQATPATYRMLLSCGFKGSPNLKLFCGGEPMTRELALDLLDKCSELWNLYGPTESCIYSSGNRIFRNTEVIPIGKPIANTDILILDERNRPVPKGVQGEICIGGMGLAKGYIGKPDLTAEKFIPHPFNQGQRIYKTGDLGYISENDVLFCLGRTDNQVKVRGYRIETGEIESTLVKSCGFSEAVVLAKSFGKDDVRLIAFLTEYGVSHKQYRTDKTCGLQIANINQKETERIRKLLADSLPEYMVPGLFIIVNAMPLTPNAKTDRKFLSNIEASCLLENVSKYQKQAGEDIPEFWNDTELAIKPIWEKALGISNSGRKDDFFASGGHSLIAIELMHQIEKELHVKIPLSALFKKPSIAGISEIIRGGANPDFKYIVPIKPHGKKAPIYIVHGAGLEVMVFKDLAAQMCDDQPVFGIQAIGLTSDELPSESLEEIALKYIEEIKLHNPNGPYLLAGFSAGSLIAFEMARQMTERGDTIKMLGVMDYSLEMCRRHTGVWTKLKKSVKEFIPRQMYALNMLFKHPKQALKYQKRFLELRLEGILSKMGISNGKNVESSSKQHFYQIADIYYKAFENYSLKPYKGKIELFRSNLKMYYLNDRKFLGWKNLATEGVEVHPVDGDHDNMILGEYTKTFAERLEEVIRQKTT